MEELEGRSEFISQRFGSVTGKEETKDPYPYEHRQTEKILNKI